MKEEMIANQGEFIKVNLVERTTEELDLIIKSEEILKLFAQMLYEIQLNEIKQLSRRSISPNAQDIQEKLDLTDRKQFARFKFTVQYLRKAALQERMRRDKLDKKKIKAES